MPNTALIWAFFMIDGAGTVARTGAGEGGLG